MSQPPPGHGRARPPGPPSPLHYRPPSPWAPSPPPLISGPRHSTALVSPPPVQPSPKPFRPLHSPFRPHSPSPSSHFSISPYPMSPTLGQSPEYYYSSPYEPVREYDYAGVPLEPPPPPRPMIYEEDEERGPSTAEIIASQSQEGYVDEKLAEYQLTIQLLQDEQERVQKKTFVNWINSHLSKRIPPLRIDDLIHDLRDGTKLLALLEVLSGEKLPMERGRVLRRPHFLSNANTALRFLAGKRIKLVNINAADLVDGRPAVVLGLIWTIILYFQIEENSRALEYLGGSRCASVMSQESGAATPTHRAEDRWKQGAKKTLLQWVANALPKDSNIHVSDFGPSWRDGVAFLAIIDAIKANLINLAEMKRKTNRQRLEHAFDVAENELGIARLLDAEDVDVEKPDERSIMTYVAQFLHKYPEPKTTGPDAVAAVQEEYESLRMWLTERVTIIQRQYDTRTLSRNYEDYVRAENDRLAREPVYQKLEKLMYTQSLVAIAPKSWRELVSLWTELERLHRRWLWLLDSDLPGDFRMVGEWLARAEYLIYFDEIPTSLDERTAAIISEKLEEHSSFFASLPEVLDRFEAALRSPDASRIPGERLQEMKERLETVNRRAPQRKARLKYLEHKCCIVAFTELTKAKLATWTGKYGRIDHVRALLDDYDNFVTKNKIFQEFDRAYVDIKEVAEEYKRVCQVDRTEAKEIDAFLREVSETWRRVASDVRCARSVLEEVIAHWERWNTMADDFTSWLDKAQHMLRVSEDERLEFFHDLTVWKEKHQLLGDAAGFLAATSSDDIASEVKRKYIEITERWERVWEEAERYVRGGDALRHRRELAAGASTLDTWLRAADNLLARQPRAATHDIQAYIDQLLQLNSEIEHHEELFKTISRTFQNAIAELPRDEVEANMAKLKQQKEALVRVRATVPVKLHQYRQLLVQHESLETGQREIGQWLDKADEALATTHQTRREIIEEQYEIHRSFFSRTTYYRSMLESKNKVFQNIVKAADADRSADVTEQVRLMRDLNDRFAHVSSEATRREAELQRLVRAWEEFEIKKRAVEEWASRAEALLADNRVDSKQAVDFHKRFFQGADERAVSELVRSGRELIELVSEEERPQVVATVEALQRRWRELLARAPPHLMRLEFRLDEAVFAHCIKDIEKEIVYEEQAYNQSDDADGILIRNEEYFRNQGKVMQVEHCLQNLKKIATSYTQQTNDTSLEEALRRCEQQWESTVHRVDPTLTETVIMCRLIYSVLVILGYTSYLPVISQYVESPCPGTFEYQSDGGGVYGVIHLQPNGPVSAIHVTVNFTIAARVFSNYAGRLEPINPSGIQFSQDSPIDYRVEFPVTTPLPRLTYLIVNGNVLCYGPGDVPQPNVYVTTISLQHMLYLRGRPGNQGLTPGFNQGFNQGSGNNGFNQGSNQGFNPFNPRPKPQDPAINIISSSPDAQVFTFNVDSDRGSWNNGFQRPQQQPETQRPLPPPPPSPPPAEYYPEYTTTTQRPAPPPPRPQTVYPSMPSRSPSFSSECGVVSGGNEHVPLVFHGTSFTRGDWPWLVAIYKRKDGSLTFACSGTLVSDRHVVSAAHCVQQRSTLTSIRDIVVKVGVYNLEDWGDDITVTRTLESATIHEGFNSSTYANDLLVLTFEKSVEFNTNIRPACLWNGNNDLNRIVGASGVVAGWGSSELGPGSKGEPRMVRIPVVSTAMCRASRPDFHVFTSDNTFCAGDRNGAGPCLGDSGGGLYILDGGRWRIRGVVSLSLRPENGESTCNLNEYVIFTDAAKFLQWIKNAISN